MLRYLIRRIAVTIALLIAVSAFSFFLVELPPGNYLTSRIASLQEARGGAQVDQAEIESLKRQFGYDKPILVRYGQWTINMFRGDFGRSFAYNAPVAPLIQERLGITIYVSILTLIVTYVLAVPIAIFSAVKQYSIGDYIFTFLGIAGLAMPTFFLALVLMYYVLTLTGGSVGGLYSQEFMNQPMSFAKLLDMHRNIAILVFAVGISGMASIIRILRSGILDEMNKHYVVAAQSKGLSRATVLAKYPVRVALNPIISTIGWILPGLVSGATVTAIVMNVPTIGLLLYESLLAQDTYVAAASIMLLSFITVVGMFLSDVLLVVVDPRIRLT